MNDDRPNGPETATGSPMGESRRFPRFYQDPSGVMLGFPTGPLAIVRAWAGEGDGDPVTLDALAEGLPHVLAWIDRFVPRQLDGLELSLGPTVGELIIEEPDLEIELIRFNGRTFVEETPAIVDDGDPHDLAFRLGEAVGSFEGGHCTKAQLADNVIEIVHGLIEDEFGPEVESGRCRVCGCTEERACSIVTPGSDVGAAIPGHYGSRACAWTDATRTLCDAPNCVARAPGLGSACDEVVAFERVPAVEGLECVKALGPAYGRDAGGRPVHIGDAEPTDAEGRFPGDLGYVRPE